MNEPAAAVTDWILAALALSAGVVLLFDEKRSRYWAFAFFAAAISAFVGAVYHAWLKASGTWSGPVWGSVTLIVAVMVSFILAATVETVLGPGSRKLWMTIRLASLLAFAVVVLLGGGSISSLLYLESVTMAAVVVIWAMAFRRKMPGSGTLLTAIVLSGGAAIVRAIPVRFVASWEWNSDSLYHIAQIPGLVAMLIGAQRLPAIVQGARRKAERVRERPAWQRSLANLRVTSRLAARLRS